MSPLVDRRAWDAYWAEPGADEDADEGAAEAAGAELDAGNVAAADPPAPGSGRKHEGSVPSPPTPGKNG